MFDSTKEFIVICSNNSKLELLKSIDKLVNVKFFSMDKFIKSYYFDYDEKAILYLIKKYKIKYSLALEYLNNLINVEDIIYNNKKLDFLVKIKKDLIDNNLLIFDTRFKKYISNKEIIVYNYSLNKFEKHLLKNIKYKVNHSESNNYIPKIYEAKDIEEEIEFVAIKISELINSGVDINRIKLANITDDYINPINKIFNFYNLKINKFNNIPIMSTIIGKTFYSNLTSIEKALKSIEEYNTTSIYEKIINICNKYIWCDDINDLKILIEYDLNHTYIENVKYTNMIDVIDCKDSSSDDYVFLMGANTGIVPRLFKDEDYINDSIKPEYLETTVEKNKKEKQDIIDWIKSIKNLTITYKLKDDLQSFYPSSILDELNSKVEKIDLDYNNSYSELSDKLHLGLFLDELIKFGSVNKNLNLLNSNYTIPYNTYSHEFTGLNKEKLKNYINNQKSFNLSYTLMDNYNRCSFRYYINKILGLTDMEDSIGIILGNIYHYVLEKWGNSKDGFVDVEGLVNDYIESNNLDLTNSNRFFINRAIKNINYVIEVLNKQKNFCNLKNIETEKFIKIPIKDNINFVGFIDKIVYDTFNKETIASIIDYKTYTYTPSLKYINSGIGLQLPTYMYLSNYSFKNIRFAGFYLQNIILDNKTDEEKEKSLKLIGFTNKDKEVLKEFDINYMDNSFIEGIKLKNDGSFTSNSLKRMLSDSEINKIIEITKNKIDETINNILNSKFDINPKYDNGNIGCEFCKYRDLCFMKDYDFKRITSDMFE